jgi:hypothetical protein
VGRLEGIDKRVGSWGKRAKEKVIEKKEAHPAMCG